MDPSPFLTMVLKVQWREIRSRGEGGRWCILHSKAPTMEQMLDEVEKYCPQELYKFVGCVEQNPSTWVHSCDELKRDLTQCSHTKVSGLAASTKVTFPDTISCQIVACTIWQGVPGTYILCNANEQSDEHFRLRERAGLWWQW